MIHDEQTNNKLLVLFVLDKLEMPISDEVLLDMCVQNNWISYLFCKEAINELCDSGFVNRQLTQSNTCFLVLSQDGALCIGHFFKDIPKSLRDQIVSTVKKNRLNYRKKQEYLTDYFRNADNTYTVVLRIMDVNQMIYETKLVVTDKSVAIEMSENWTERGAEVYKNLYEILVQEE